MPREGRRARYFHGRAWKYTFKRLDKPMKALSLRQPWAWLVFHGKDVENRTWATSYRGPLLIHASMNYDLEGHEWALAWRLPRPTGG